MLFWQRSFVSGEPFRYRIFPFGTESGPDGDGISRPKHDFGTEPSSPRLRRSFDGSKFRWKAFRPPGFPFGTELNFGDERSVPKHIPGPAFQRNFNGKPLVLSSNFRWKWLQFYIISVPNCNFGSNFRWKSIRKTSEKSTKKCISGTHFRWKTVSIIIEFFDHFRAVGRRGRRPTETKLRWKTVRKTTELA